MAYGSCSELETLLSLSKDLGFLDQNSFDKIYTITRRNLEIIKKFNRIFIPKMIYFAPLERKEKTCCENLSPPPSPLPPVQKPRLLIVEDDESIRTQMKWALMQDYDVFLSEDRAGALDLLRLEKPTVVTLDLGLPPNPGGCERRFCCFG